MAARVITWMALALLVGSSAADEPPRIPPAYRWAAHTAGVPEALLWAVVLEESGTPLHGRILPWPWTVNVAGVPARYATRASACTALRRALERTVPTRIDAGLGQINLGYYGNRFEHRCDVLDPYTNLLLAATLLHGHHVPGEDWLIAAGRYHRPAGGAEAVRYQRRIAQHLPHESAFTAYAVRSVVPTIHGAERAP